MARIRFTAHFRIRRRDIVLAGGFLLFSLGTAQAQLQCATCHPQIAASFAKTGMGRSFYKPDERIVPPAEPYLHQKSGTWYAMQPNAAGALTQRRWRVDSDGKPVHMRELAVDYVMGSGNHARSFLHRTPRGGLLELPLAWYAENGGTWALSPGHDREYTLPPRAIAYECMFCHNRYPAIPAGHEEPGAEPLFSGALPQGIDCQRCHGSGAAHIAKAQASQPVAEIRAAILNPAHLSKDRQLEICMQCHLETTALPLPHSMLQLGRGPFSYDPREPLAGFFQFFDFAPGTPNQQDFEIAHSAYRLRESKCFLQSAGNLTCTTCHNPHAPARPAQSYNATCEGCHVALTGHPATATDCIACHMPKRRTRDVIHAVMTDHWIQRRPPPGNPLAPIAEREAFDQNPYRGPVLPYYPAKSDPLVLAMAQVSGKSNLRAGLPRLAAEIARRRPMQPDPFIELGQGYLAANQLPKAAAALDEALRHKPDSVAALLSLSDVLTQSGQATRAVTLLDKALKLAPEEPLLWYQLALAQSKANAPDQAQAALVKATELDPDLAEAHELLGEMLATRGDSAPAEREFNAALTINPDLPEALANLGQLFGLRGQLTAAIAYLGRAAKLNPKDVDTRVNYAVALGSMGQLAEAEVQIDAALERFPALPNAHYIKGSILEKRGAQDKALDEFLLAIRLQPGYRAAHIAAAQVLDRKGDKAAAEQHRRLAR